MAEAENCRGECGGGLLVDITADGEVGVNTDASSGHGARSWTLTHHCVRRP